MSVYESGDYVKLEFKDDKSRDNEWMWVRVDYSDDAKRIHSLCEIEDGILNVVDRVHHASTFIEHDANAAGHFLRLEHRDFLRETFSIHAEIFLAQSTDGC